MATKRISSNLYTCEQVRRLDKQAIDSGIPGIQLMKRAGRALFSAILQQWPSRRRLLVFCGGGNNGGDGYVVAALAAEQKLDVKIIALIDPRALSGDAKLAYQYAVQESVDVFSWSEKLSLEVDSEETVIVDALLGTGTVGAPRGNFSEAISWINSSGIPVASADIPSGLNGDSGGAALAVRADLTVSFVACKRGLLTGKGPALTGDLLVDDLGVPSQIFEDEVPSVKNISTFSRLYTLVERPADAHKGLFGHLMIIGGDTGYGGAVAMAAETALCSGAGLVSVATQAEHVPAILSRVPEVMVHGVASGQALKPLLERPSVIVIGPGLGRSPWSEQMLQQVLSTNIPLVLDADALNILAQGRIGKNMSRDNWIMTPHPGEAARLLGVDTSEIQVDRFLSAEKIQEKFGGVCVLKGAGSIVVSKQCTSLAKVGNPGMATAGMGDVLAGLCGALLAQGLSPKDSAELGVCVHGDAGDLAAANSGYRGLRATELIPYIRELLNPCDENSVNRI